MHSYMMERLQLKEEPSNEQEKRISTTCERLREDQVYRRRLFHTACTTWAMVSSGACHTLIGLAFPDLMLLIKQDLAEASWIFTTWSFGNMVGSLLTGYAYDRFNKLMVLISLSLGLAVTTGTTPWCTSFPLMLIIHLVGGGFASGIHLAVTADTIYLWKKEKDTFLQIVHLAATAGGILSPFLVNPFLSKLNRGDAMLQNESFAEDMDKVNNSNTFSKKDINSSSLLNRETFKASDSKIQYAYLLASGVALIGAISYLMVNISSGNVYSKKGTEKNNYSPTGNSTKIHNKLLSRKIISLYVFCVSVQIMLYVTMQRHEFGLFMTYVIHKLNWSKKKASNILAVFWCVFCFGRIIAVIALRIFKEDYLNWCYMFLTCVGVTGLCVSCFLQFSTIVVVSLLISAFGMAPLFTFMLSWFSSNITLVTGRLTGVVYVFMAIGSMVVPAISGYLMNNISYDWFIFILFILLSLLIFVTFILRLLHRKLARVSE